MRNPTRYRILSLGICFVLISVDCSYKSRPSLRLSVKPEPTMGDSVSDGQVALFLLDEDPIYLAMNKVPTDQQATQVHQANPKLRVLAGKLNARRFGAYSLGPDVFVFLDQSRPLWESHVVRSVQSDRDGSSRVDNLKRGPYWLMGYKQGKETEAFWLQYVTITDGATEVVLERGNALYYDRRS